MGRNKTEGIIPKHLVEYREQYRQLIQTYLPCVSDKATRQMIRALEQPRNGFWSKVIRPNLLLDAQGRPRDGIDFDYDQGTPPSLRPIYTPISDSVRTPGRNHFGARIAADMEPHLPQGEFAVFANFLRGGCCDSEGQWESPSARVTLGPYTVFTLEYDPSGDRERQLRALDTQLGWVRKSGCNDLDRPIRPVWDWGCQHSDFRGLCVSWSGNKSVHINLLFDTSSLMAEFPELRDQFRLVYQSLWTEMAARIGPMLSQEWVPDPAMRLPEQYRKLPNGVLVIESRKAPHLLGIPEGTLVPQLCVWEKYLSRAAAGADRAFVNEAVLKQNAGDAQPRASRYRRRSGIGDMTPDEHRYCSERFNELIASKGGRDGYPRGAGLHRETVWVGRLYANETDANPSTIILEDSHQTYVQGGKRPSRSLSIGLPLRIHIGKWRREYALSRGCQPTYPLRDDLLPEAQVRHEERRFANEAVSTDAARQTLQELIPAILDAHELMLVRAPEGIGKTTAIAQHLPELSQRLAAAARKEIGIGDHPRRDVEWRRPSAFAFSSYALATEKAKEFNDSPAGAHLMGIVMPSFSRLYEETRKALDVEEAITARAAAKAGHDSVAAAIRYRQPKVWSEMARRHRGLFEAVKAPDARRSRVLYFVVHQVLQQLNTNLLAAAFLHPAFFRTETKDWWQLAEAMRLRVAVHDELPLEALVSMHRADKVEWCLDLFELQPEVWQDADVGLVEKYRSYEAKRAGGTPPVSFDELLEIHRVGYGRSDQTAVAECETYGSGNLYSTTHGRRWYARRRKWWDGLAQRTILLTTEALPTHMARDLDAIEVFDLRAPLVGAGTIELRLWPSCSSGDAVEIVDRLRSEVDDPDLHVITNRAAVADGTSTHAGARGSNQYTGRSLGQTAFYKSPDEYEQLQVINRVFDLTAAIRLRHVDEINQTAGRNLGFRHDGVTRHHLAMGWALYGEIEQVLYGECRYRLTLVEDADRRRCDVYTQSRAAARSAQRQTEQEQAMLEHIELAGGLNDEVSVQC